MSEPNLPEPWYYQPEVRRRLLPAARALRNLMLIVGYYVGRPALVALVAIGLVWAVAPRWLEPLMTTYRAAYTGLWTGAALGVVAALIYRWRFPDNKKAPRVLVPLLTGLGLVCGALVAFGGSLGGQIAFLFCLLGVTGYAYVEGLPPE